MRGLRLAWGVLVAVALLAGGVVLSDVLLANGRWIALEMPALAAAVIGPEPVELQLSVLLAVAASGALALLLLAIGTLYYLWRRRQYESLIARLERELVNLRNLPFTHPAPLEDLPAVAEELRGPGRSGEGAPP